MIKKSTGSGVDFMPNDQLANKLHKPIITEFKRRKAYSSFKNNIWGIDLADMKSLIKYNKGIKYFLWAIDLFSKYAWVVYASFKNKRGATTANAFKAISRVKKKTNKIWADQGGEFYNNLFKRFSVIAESFIRPLKNKIYKHMTALSKIVLFWCFRWYC